MPKSQALLDQDGLWEQLMADMQEMHDSARVALGCLKTPSREPF
jgi:hypothetical protein